MSLIKWSPKKRNMDLSLWPGREMEQMFENFFMDWPNPARLLRREEEEQFYFPYFDLREEEDDYVLTADLPGVKKEDLDITATEDRIILKGEHKEETEESDKGYFHKERYFGSFQRSIALPGGIRSEEVKASLKDGVLTLRLPKIATAKTRHIEISEVSEQ